LFDYPFISNFGKPMTDPAIAPVPFDSATLVDLTAQLIGLELDPAHRSGVIANLERTAAIAKLVMEFPIADEVEVATVFQP
jgi:Protein of unknown function (DUF4089)